VSRPLETRDLVEVLDEASSIVRGGRLSPGSIRRKDDGSPVTALDAEVDAFLRAQLTRLVPGSGWLSEESPDDGSRRCSALAWIVDPIDGTKELIAGRDEIAISIALVRAGRVIAAAVANPLRAERGVWIEGGTAAFEGLAPVAAPVSLDTTRAIVSRTEWSRGDLRGLEGIFAETRPVGSVAYKLLRVASGADHFTYSVRPKREWDVCGGVGLVLGSGGSYARLDDVPIAFNRDDTRIPSGHVAGPPALVPAAKQALLEKLASR
jgi:myo-inositol-1(or 4)-monophosphatase